uniref:Secreted protein n=1 Tax=Nelumbo nucifera TaxID=4432 RepID=A0A822ZK25_NELNU|nr:TPA_asm: hypothetical protein HUJ06_001596 [Nelumbo nucifera]
MPVLVFIVLGLFAVATSAEEDPLLLSDVCGRDISTLLPPPYSNSSCFTCASVWNTFILRHSQSDNVLTVIVSAVYTSGWI